MMLAPHYLEDDEWEALREIVLAQGDKSAFSGRYMTPTDMILRALPLATTETQRQLLLRGLETTKRWFPERKLN